MFEIRKAKALAPNVKLFEIQAPLIANKFKAGQFIILRLKDSGERVPLTIADANPEKGTITLVVQGIGRTTKRLNDLVEGDVISDIVGPLGKASHIEKVGTVVVIGGGVGTAIAYPTAKAFKKAGNRVITIIGGRNKELVILEDEVKAISDEVRITTDDGSYGVKGIVTDALKEIIARESVHEVLAIGPIPMMKAISDVTRPSNIKTTVSLNPIMIDGTGMCGGCRVNVGGKTLFACVDGPEFDAHQVDFTTLSARNRAYHTQERQDVVETKKEEAPHRQLSKGCHLAELEGVNLDFATITVKDRLKIPRAKMHEQDASIRRHNFKEVNTGLTLEEAKREALRCLNCKHAPCVGGCPVGINIPQFLSLLAQGRLEESYMVLRQDNCLPAVTGRVCPQENQCEGVCIRAKNKCDGAVGVGYLERFVADWARENIPSQKIEKKKETGKRVAIVGSGPAGLAVAGDLVSFGHHVEVFEALHEMGGVLTYGIPEFRLPKDIVRQQIDGLKKEGVVFVPNVVIGKTLTVDELMKTFDSVFIGTGAGLPLFMNIKGEDLNGVYSANEFLTRANLMKAYDFPNNDTPVYDCRGKDVAVFGGGNTAMDAVRTSLRLGARKAYLIYRRTEKEMPARLEELHHAKEEGTEIIELSAPMHFIGGDQHDLKGVCLQKMQLGEADESGRRRPVVIPGSEYNLDIGMAIVAIGNGSNPLISYTSPDIKTNKWGNLIANEETLKTTKKGVFAGGDIVTGGATVILAMGAGRKAAKAIHEYLVTGLW